eukprot:11563087-Alexandrium_andersonii.AAC.1
MAGEADSTEQYGPPGPGRRGGSREGLRGPVAAPPPARQVVEPAPLPARQYAEWRTGDGYCRRCKTHN